MDLYCPKCGEPWDNEEFHYRAEETGTSYSFTAGQFREHGCLALGGRCSPRELEPVALGLTRAEAASALYDVLGDDMDGAAAMLEDFGF